MQAGAQVVGGLAQGAGLQRLCTLSRQGAASFWAGAELQT